MSVSSHLRLTLLVDHYARPPYVSEYGLSIYLEGDSWRALFDLGQTPAALSKNAELAGLRPGSVDFIVISHEHFDHVGGLPAASRLARPGAPVFIPAGANWRLAKAIEGSGLTPKPLIAGGDAAPGVLITSQQYGPPYEHAALIRVGGLGQVLLVGCSHPGISKVVSKVIYDTGSPPYAVIGGMHLAWSPEDRVKMEVEALKNMGVRLLVPLHCSGDLVPRVASSVGLEVRRLNVGESIEL